MTTTAPSNTKITTTSSTTTTVVPSQVSSSLTIRNSIPAITAIKSEEPRKSVEDDKNTMEVVSANPLTPHLKKNQSILDIKMDTAKLHHQHIMLNMLRTTPVTAKNFYKVSNVCKIYF